MYSLLIFLLILLLIFYHYQKLIQLRKDLPIITEGSYELVNADDSEVFSYVRRLGNKRLLVICSFAKEKVPYEIPAEFSAVHAKARLILTNYTKHPATLEDKMILRPYEALAYYIDE